MKPLLLFVGLLLAAGPAAAQAPRVLASPDAVGAPAVAPAAPDTVAALHRLFAAKRKKLVPIVAGTLVADVAGIAVIGATVESGGLIDGRVVGQVLTGLLGVVAMTTEVLFYSANYGKKKEELAVAAFEAHQLPRHLKRQLKAKYFQELPPAAQR